jgi:hypothetical protein
LVLRLAQRGCQSYTKKGWHERVALFAAFPLHDLVGSTAVVLPQVCTLLSVRKHYPRKQFVCCWEVSERLEHTGSFDVVESADSINLSDGSPGVEVREHP